MAMKVLRICIVAAAVAFLGSCQVLEFLLSSVFPSTVVLVRAQASLSGQIPASEASSFSLRLVQSGTNAYVVVIGPQQGTPYSVAYVYDLDLNLKSTQTNLLSDSGVMTDSSGYIVAGSRQLKAADLSLVTTLGAQVTTNQGPVGVDGFIDGSGNNLLGFYTSGATFYWGGYNPTWTNGLAMGGFPALSAVMPNLFLDAVLDDWVSGGSVFVVVSPSGGGGNQTVTQYFLKAAKTNFTSTALTGLADMSPHHDGLYPQSIGFAQGYLLAFEGSSSSFVRIDPANGATVSSLSSDMDFSNAQFAYLVSGGAFYVYDTKTRALTKYAAWW